MALSAQACCSSSSLLLCHHLLMHRAGIHCLTVPCSLSDSWGRIGLFLTPMQKPPVSVVEPWTAVRFKIIKAVNTCILSLLVTANTWTLGWKLLPSQSTLESLGSNPLFRNYTTHGKDEKTFFSVQSGHSGTLKHLARAVIAHSFLAHRIYIWL